MFVSVVVFNSTRFAQQMGNGDPITNAVANLQPHSVFIDTTTGKTWYWDVATPTWIIE